MGFPALSLPGAFSEHKAHSPALNAIWALPHLGPWAPLLLFSLLFPSQAAGAGHDPEDPGRVGKAARGSLGSLLGKVCRKRLYRSGSLHSGPKWPL